MTTPGKVAAVAPDGTPIEVPADEAAALKASGGHVMTAAEEDTARRRIDFEHRLGGAEAVFAPPVVGAARGLTFGLSDQALASSPALRSRLADYEDFAPDALRAGELTGVVGGALLGVGAPALAERAGIAAEGVGGFLARGAAEGALLGTGDAISENALSDHALTGEALIGGAAHGALGGAIANGALGLAGRGIRSLSSAGLGDSIDTLASRTYGEAAPGVGKTLADVEASAAAPARPNLADVAANRYIDNLPGSTATERAAQAEAWAARDRVLSKHAETVDGASRNFSQSLDEALTAGREVDMGTFGDSKTNHMSKLVDTSRAEAQAEHTFNWLLDADQKVQGLAKDANSHMTSGDLKQWNGWMKELGGEGGSIETRDSLQMHSSLDDLKRWLGKQAKFGRGPYGLTRAAREFEDLYQGEHGNGGLRAMLEEPIWGEQAAAAQKNVNRATTDFLADGKNFQQKFTTQVTSDAGRPVYGANTAAVDSFMNRLSSPANDGDARAAEGWMNTRLKYLDATEASYPHDASTLSAVDRERNALKRLQEVYKQTTKDVSLANQVRSALSEERERGFGGAVGALFDIAAKPYTTLQRLAQIESQTKGVLNRIGGNVRGLIRDGTGTLPRSGSPAKRAFFSSLLDGLKQSPSATASSAVGARVSHQLFAKRAEQLARVQGNPILVTANIARSLDPVHAAAPNVANQATSVALRGLDFLVGKLPPSRKDDFSLQPQLEPGPRASDAETSRFLRYVEALDDPTLVLREARSNTLSRDHVEAVRAVYPKLYDAMRVEVMNELVQSKTKLPYQRRIQLGILLDVPTDRTLAPPYIRAIQQTYSAAGPNGEGPDLDFTNTLQTDTQAAAEPVGE